MTVDGGMGYNQRKDADPDLAPDPRRDTPSKRGIDMDSSAETALSAFAGSKTRHGTQSGWSKHKTLGERPCDPCWTAKSAYDRRQRLIPEVTRKSRLHARAQGRAYNRLAAMHPAIYAALYVEEKARLVALANQPGGAA